jgi:hypothetical protein
MRVSQLADRTATGTAGDERSMDMHTLAILCFCIIGHEKKTTNLDNVF